MTLNVYGRILKKSKRVVFISMFSEKTSISSYPPVSRKMPKNNHLDLRNNDGAPLEL